MVRLYLFAEGQTEQTFADTVLRPHLAKYGVFLQGPILVATRKRKGKIYRGGGRHYLPMKNDIVRFLKQEKGADVFFTTMIDLFRIHSDFPGLEAAEKMKNDPYKCVQTVEIAFANDIGDRRFIPFIQLYEYEAYLFTDPLKIGGFYPNCERQTQRLKTIADSKASPELINDGAETAPSKRIIAEFPDYEDAKRVVGPQVAEWIGLDAIRTKCPHFNDWLSRLEKLAGNKI